MRPLFSISEIPCYHRGETNYTMLNGNTGPLVYPAGFVYIFTGLYHLTNKGTDVRAAQWIFSGIYLACFSVIALIYAAAAKTNKNHKWYHPALCLGCLCVSKRIHSIFVLRMFNDCELPHPPHTSALSKTHRCFRYLSAVAMLLVYVAIFLFTKQWWKLGCTFFSIAFSVMK